MGIINILKKTYELKNYVQSGLRKQFQLDLLELGKES